MKLSKAAFALLAALLFGASTPVAKLVISKIDPFLLAGILYLGSGLGLSTWLAARHVLRVAKFPALTFNNKTEPWCLVGAILFGGIVAPVLLMIGLHKSKSSTASLLLNLETAFTVAIACLVFREKYAKRLVLGFVLLLIGGGCLSLSEKEFGGDALGMIAIAAACAGWAIDNNLTKYVGSLDATLLAALKGVIAGIVNVTLALSLGQHLPSAPVIGSSLAIGFVGYGLSLVFFILSLRKIGAARTSAYFSTAPFAGAALSIILLREPFTWPLSVSGVLMAIGVYLHLTETHSHEHTHEPLEHDHLHRHDEHHEHEHLPSDPPGEPHSHLHRHDRLRHSHPHEHDDLHHRHSH